MILLDTCTLIFDALTPDRLSPAARKALNRGESEGSLACADITLWEIAMLVSKGRLDPTIDSATFCHLALDARGVRVLSITPEIAMASTRIELPQGDPADRLIAATAVEYAAVVLTIDERLRRSTVVQTLW